MKIYEFTFHDNRTGNNIEKIPDIHEFYHTRREALKRLNEYKEKIKDWGKQFTFRDCTYSTWANDRGLSIDVKPQLIPRYADVSCTMVANLSCFDTKD